MKPNYRKHPYHASCVRWDGDNLAEIQALLPHAELYREVYIVLRSAYRMDTLYIGDWVAKGENGDIKCYKPEQFAVKYERIE